MPRCRRTNPIFSSGTPWRSISVAAVCRRTCAPLTGATTPARCIRRFTTDETPSPFRNGDGVSSVVKRLMQRAGVVAPVKGAHVLRHTAATEMLRHGVPLEKIGLVLRHRGIDTTAYYAKVDVTLLRQVVQAWPEVL